MGNATGAFGCRSWEVVRIVGCGGKGAAAFLLNTPHVSLRSWIGAEHKCQQQQECDNRAEGLRNILVARDSTHVAYITELLNK